MHEPAVLCCKPLQGADFWGVAEYEVDTIQYFSELSSLGAKFNRDRYYFDVKVDLPDIR